MRNLRSKRGGCQNMNAKDRSELMTKIRDWICKYHNEFDNKGFAWTPNICADVWYEIAKKPVKTAETIQVTISVRERESNMIVLLLIFFRDSDFCIVRYTHWVEPELHDFLSNRIKTFINEHGGHQFRVKDSDLT